MNGDPWEPFSTRRVSCPDCGTSSPKTASPDEAMDWREQHACPVRSAA
jgi:hypothetical protein